jgi:uridine monophosphate synthetase
LRQIIAYPRLLKEIGEQLWQHVQQKSPDLLCGVPYTALPIATTISVAHTIPMVMVRKEPKAYGTKKQVEGVFNAGQTCFIIEDLVTTGGSVLKAAAILEETGLVVNDVAVVIDRQQGGKENLAAKGYQLHALMSISELLKTLQDAGKLSLAEKEKAQEFLGTLTC